MSGETDPVMALLKELADTNEALIGLAHLLFGLEIGRGDTSAEDLAAAVEDQAARVGAEHPNALLLKLAASLRSAHGGLKVIEGGKSDDA